jgi:hypothetical protein
MNIFLVSLFVSLSPRRLSPYIYVYIYMCTYMCVYIIFWTTYIFFKFQNLCQHPSGKRLHHFLENCVTLVVT